jgi:hypothetical protein
MYVCVSYIKPSDQFVIWGVEKYRRKHKNMCCENMCALNLLHRLYVCILGKSIICPAASAHSHDVSAAKKIICVHIVWWQSLPFAWLWAPNVTSLRGHMYDSGTKSWPCMALAYDATRREGVRTHPGHEWDALKGLWYMFRPLFTSMVFERMGGDYFVSRNFSDRLFTSPNFTGIILRYPYKFSPL